MKGENQKRKQERKFKDRNMEIKKERHYKRKNKLRKGEWKKEKRQKRLQLLQGLAVRKHFIYRDVVNYKVAHSTSV